MNKTHNKRLEAFKKKAAREKRLNNYLGCHSNDYTNHRGNRIERDTTEQPAKRIVNGRELADVANACSLSDVMLGAENMTDTTLRQLKRCTEHQLRKRGLL